MSSLVYKLDMVPHCLLEEPDRRRISTLVVHMREVLIVVPVKYSANVNVVGGDGDVAVEKEAQLKNLSSQAQISLGNHLRYDDVRCHDERICFHKVDTCDCVL